MNLKVEHFELTSMFIHASETLLKYIKLDSEFKY